MSTQKYRLIETRWLEESVNYSGTELRGHFVRERAGIATDGLIAFAGECDVSGEALVDLEDAGAGKMIRARRMLHFIGEHFQCGLREANFRLRLFTEIVRISIEDLAPDIVVIRVGDDLFVRERKLSVAIATQSPTSALFHFGVNIDPLGAPVPAIGLDELGIDPRRLADMVFERYEEECVSVELAVRKVKGVT